MARKCMRCHRFKGDSSYFNSMAKKCEDCRHELVVLANNKPTKNIINPQQKAILVKYFGETRNHYLYKLKRRMGITVQQFVQMIEAQEGKCAICKVFDPKKLQMDHCHQTHKVRELLCPRCNNAIGKFDDNYKLLEAAASYLKLHT